LGGVDRRHKVGSVTIIIFDPYEGEGNPPDVEGYLRECERRRTAFEVVHFPGLRWKEADRQLKRLMPPVQPHRSIRGLGAQDVPPPDWWQDWELG